MKTACEIKQIVKNCLSYRDQPGSPCNGCPYQNEYSFCKAAMARDIIECIEGLEERISLMMIQMHGDCGVCKHRNESAFQSPCAECTDTKDNELWEYEGLPEVKHEKYQD